jgi:hypothetical protein
MTMRPHEGSLYRLVKRVIDEWDPVDLLSHAPPDEYDPEIREITRRMTHPKHLKNWLKVLSVFSLRILGRRTSARLKNVSPSLNVAVFDVQDVP